MFRSSRCATPRRLAITCASSSSASAAAGLAGRHPAIDRKGQRDQRVPEEQAFHLRQRQYPLDPHRHARRKKMRAMTEDLAQDSLPAGLVEKGGFRTRFNEGVPACQRSRVVGFQALDAKGSLAAQPAWPLPRRSFHCFATDGQRTARRETPHPSAPSGNRRAIAEPAFGVLQIDVVAKARLGTDTGNARLPGIDLPGMEIEDRRLTIPLVDLSAAASATAHRAAAEVAATAGRPVAVKEACRAHRQFQQAGAHPVREARRIRHAVVIMANRVDARTVAVTGTFETVESPEIAFANRKTRRPVAPDFLTRDIFQQLLGRSTSAEKVGFGQITGTLMTVAVTGQFVAIVDDPPHEMRIAFGDPAEREKGRPVCISSSISRIRSTFRSTRHSRRCPLIARNIRSERRNLEVVFDVDRQGVGHRLAGHFASFVVASGRAAHGARAATARDRRRFALPPDHPRTRERDRSCRRRTGFRRRPARIAPRSQPTRVLVPCSTVIGRSVFSRIVRQGTPRAVVSSCRPPESESTSFAPASRPSISR
jgi:hypothetical protein